MLLALMLVRLSCMAMQVLLPSPSTAHGDEGEASLLKAVALPPLRGESGAGELNTMRPELALVGSLRLGSGAGATTSMPPRCRPRQQFSVHNAAFEC